MDHHQTLDTAISRGLVYLQNCQLPDGTFPIFRYIPSDPKPIAPTKPALPATALILTTLSQLPKQRTLKLCPATASWLQAQHLYGQGFPYWPVDIPYAANTTPTHLYSTFCALNALQQFNPTSISPVLLGNMAKMLIRSEAHIGGPYAINAHAGASTQERDIDLVLNCLIARFIADIAEPLPNVIAYITQAIGRYAFHSPHYTSVHPVLYDIACAYRGALGNTIIEYLQSTAKNGHWDSPLATALAVLTHDKLGATVPPAAISYLVTMQQKDGSWPGKDYYNTPDGHTIGAPALTTALALGALDSYIPQSARPTNSPASLERVKPADRASLIYGEIMATVKDELSRLDVPLRSYALGMLKRIQQADTNREIGLVGYLFGQSLMKPPMQLNNTLYTEIGVANIYNWMAYTVYDDFLDDEGDPRLLSVANVALRYSVHHFRKALPKNTTFHLWANSLFDTIDEANAWELEECRFAVSEGKITIGHLPQYNDYARLADRSCTHSLPVAAVLASQGVQPRSKLANTCHGAFRHYLIARQLNDDMHDWEEDIQRGHISSVVAHILDQLDIPAGTTLPLGELIPTMRQQFWDHTLEDICKAITLHTQQGRVAAKQSKMLNTLHIIEQLLTSLDQVVERSLAERNDANAFLAGYKETPEKDATHI